MEPSLVSPSYMEYCNLSVLYEPSSYPSLYSMVPSTSQDSAEYVSVIQPHPTYAHGFNLGFDLPLEYPGHPMGVTIPRQDIFLGFDQQDINTGMGNSLTSSNTLCHPIKHEIATSGYSPPIYSPMPPPDTSYPPDPTPSDLFDQYSTLTQNPNALVDSLTHHQTHNDRNQLNQSVSSPFKPKKTYLRKKPKRKNHVGKTKVTDLVFNKSKLRTCDNGRVTMTSEPPNDVPEGVRTMSPITIEFTTDPSDTDPRELESFSEQFKRRRIKLEMTQTDVGRALAHLHIPGVGKLSQSTICRFESLTLSHNNMIALKPLLEAWLEKAERVVLQNEPWETHELLPRRNKRRRTAIATREKVLLEECFQYQKRPSGKALADIAAKLDLPKNVVRVWFCNRRQKDRKNASDVQWHNQNNIPHPQSGLEQLYST